MQLVPRYDGPRLIEDHRPVGPLAETVRAQRRRLAALLTALPAEAWDAPTRCERWVVRDVVAHLVTVDRYWAASAGAARRGEPLRALAGGFDPAATPDALLGDLRARPVADLLAQLTAAQDRFAQALDGVTADEWACPAETPVGHLALRSMAEHALWDCWVHERDLAVPLGLDTEAVDDDLRACIVYPAALGVALAALRDDAGPASLAVAATTPDVQVTIDLVRRGDAAVAVVRDGVTPDAACLRGNALALADVLGLRAPCPPDAPEAWRRRLAETTRVVATSS